MASFVRLDLKPRLGPRNPIAAAGDLAWYPVDAVPEGWVVLNAGYFEPAQYPELFRAIGFRFGRNDKGQFRIPAFSDFLRVHNGEATGDNANRVAFSHENDELRNHGHGGASTTYTGGHTHDMTVRGSRAVYPWNNARSPNGGQASPGMYGVQSIGTTGSGGHSHTASTTTVGGVETAPDHVVYRLCLCTGLDSGLLYVPPLGLIEPPVDGTPTPTPVVSGYPAFVKWLSTRAYRSGRVTDGQNGNTYIPTTTATAEAAKRWWVYGIEYSPPTLREGYMIGTPFAQAGILNSGRVYSSSALAHVMYHLVPSKAIGDEILANKRQVAMRWMNYESLYDGLPVVTRNGITNLAYGAGQLVNTIPISEFLYWDEAQNKVMRMLAPHRPGSVPTEMLLVETYADFVSFLTSKYGAAKPTNSDIVGKTGNPGAWTVGSGQGIVTSDGRGVRFDSTLEKLMTLPGVPKAVQDDYTFNRRTFGVTFGQNYVSNGYQFVEITGLYYWDAAAQVGVQVFNPTVPIFT